MGKLRQFDITLNNPQGVYYPGQVIQGHVTVELIEEMKMRGIHATFYGSSRVRWSEGSSKNRRHYSARETYFVCEIVLFGKASGGRGDNPTLSAGLYTYPFQFQLPQGVPSSFEGGAGRVRYWIHGRIDKPWKFDHTTKRVFTVLNPLDLNTEPRAMNGMTNDASKALCCFCCKSGPISCLLQLDRCGYVPGECIPIKGEIINNSNRKMCKTSAELYMATTYHATSKSRTWRHKVSEVFRGEIPPGDSDTWTGQLLPIPPLPPSHLSGCRIIDITYYVQLCVDPAGPALDLAVPINVIIGSIPLRSTLQQYGMGPPTAAPDSIQLYQETWSAPGSSHTNMPPPSYAESVFGKVDIRDEEDSEHMKGNRNYTPMYTYYNWGNSASPSAPPAP